MERYVPTTLTAIVLLTILMFTVEAKEIEVKVVTLTGKSLPVRLEQDATVRTLKVMYF